MRTSERFLGLCGAHREEGGVDRELRRSEENRKRKKFVMDGIGKRRKSKVSALSLDEERGSPGLAKRGLGGQKELVEKRLPSPLPVERRCNW